MPGDTPPTVHHLAGGFRLDLRRGCLFDGDGTEIPLRRKSFEVFRHLAANAGRLVGRDELMEAVWPSVHVNEDSATQCVAEVRRALGDMGRQMLRTVPGRGYLIEPAFVLRADAALPAAADGKAREDGGLPSTQGEGAPDHPPPRRPLPDRPSLVVLPFANMSGDPEQEYFADGISEELTTALSRVRSFFVIARNSAFTYKGRAVDVRQVGAELGVRYVLEGSVRKAGERVRITGQLIEAETGSHVWADRFDGELADIFGLQDRVAEAVVRAAAPSLRNAEIRRARKTPTGSLDAYDLYLRALPHFYGMTREGNEEALRCARRALDLDPDFAPAAVLAALVLIYRSAQDWASPGADNAEIVRLARWAVATGPAEPEVLAAAAQAMSYASVEAHEEAIDLVGRALALGPSGATVLGFCGWTYAYVGRPGEALEFFERAMRFDPLDPMAYSTLTAIAFCQIQLGKDAAAIEAAGRAVAQNPNFSTPRRLKAAAQALLGQMDEAAATARLVLERYEPGFTLTAYASRIHLAVQAKARAIEGMRKAGFPE